MLHDLCFLAVAVHQTECVAALECGIVGTGLSHLNDALIGVGSLFKGAVVEAAVTDTVQGIGECRVSITGNVAAEHHLCLAVLLQREEGITLQVEGGIVVLRVLRIRLGKVGIDELVAFVVVVQAVVAFRQVVIRLGFVLR